MRTRFQYLLLLATLGLPLAAHADDAPLTIAPSVEFTEKVTRFEVVEGGSAFTPIYNTLTLSVAVAKNRWYAAVSKDTTVNRWAGDIYNINGANWEWVELEYGRSENNLSIGYQVYRGSDRFGPVNLFVGYLDGNSRFVKNETDWNNSSSTLTTKLETVLFDEKGPYIGVNYTHPVGKNNLTFSLAYAKLDGQLEDYSAEGSSKSWEIVDSRSNGYSVGVSWGGSMAQNMSYKIGYKRVNYGFDGYRLHDVIAGTTSAASLTIREVVDIYSIGATIYF